MEPGLGNGLFAVGADRTRDLGIIEAPQVPLPDVVEAAGICISRCGDIAVAVICGNGTDRLYREWQLRVRILR